MVETGEPSFTVMEDDDSHPVQTSEREYKLYSGSSVAHVRIVSPPAVGRPRGRCQVVGTGQAKTAEEEVPRNADNERRARFVARPALPTLSKAQVLLKNAEHISVRGDPCVSRQYAEEKYQTLV